MTEPSGRAFSLILVGVFVAVWLIVFVPILIGELR